MADEREPYGRDPLDGDDNAHHREMWDQFKWRRRLREATVIWIKTSTAVATFLVTVWALIQAWRGGK